MQKKIARLQKKNLQYLYKLKKNMYFNSSENLRHLKFIYII